MLFRSLAAIRGAHVHHYGKAFRPGRKLGHVTVTGLLPHEVVETAEVVRAILSI